MRFPILILVTVGAVVAATPASVAKPPTCTPGKERAGCSLKAGRWTNTDGSLTVVVGKKGFVTLEGKAYIGLASAISKTCDDGAGGQGSAIANAGTTSQRPKVGETYTWKSAGVNGTTTAQVKFKTANQVKVTITGFGRVSPATPLCAISRSGTVLRVSNSSRR